MLVPQIRKHIADLKDQIRIAQDQLDIYKHIHKGTIIYTIACLINTARDGVASWHYSYKPALLKCIDWAYDIEGFLLKFDVIASEDPEPYSPLYQKEYSGRQAIIKGPEFHCAKQIKIIPKEDLILYINLPYKTALFEKLLKGL